MKVRAPIGSYALALAIVVADGGAAVTATPGADAPPTGHAALSGVWFNNKFSTDRNDVLPEELPRTRYTADGQPPPFQPWARAEVEKRLNSFKEGHPFAKLSARCLPGGVPQMMQPPPQLPIQIIQTPGQITILFESMSVFRIIRMNEQHPADPDPTFMGNSVGHWEGDTLVVDTIALNEITTIDDVIPHSDQLHIVERFHMTSPTTMEILTTVDDPKTFTRPYAYRFSFKRVPGEHLHEFLCVNNRNAPDENNQTTAKLSSSPAK